MRQRPDRAETETALTAEPNTQPFDAHDHEEADGGSVAPSLANRLAGRRHAHTSAVRLHRALLTHPRRGAIPTPEDAVITPTDLGIMDGRSSANAEELMGAGDPGSSASFAGEETLATLREVSINKVFLSAGGIHATSGVSCSNFHEVAIKRAAMATAMHNDRVADSSKFGKVKPAFFAELLQFEAVVTDPAIGAEQREALETAGAALPTAGRNCPAGRAGLIGRSASLAPALGFFDGGRPRAPVVKAEVRPRRPLHVRLLVCARHEKRDLTDLIAEDDRVRHARLVKVAGGDAAALRCLSEFCPGLIARCQRLAGQKRQSGGNRNTHETLPPNPFNVAARDYRWPDPRFKVGGASKRAAESAEHSIFGDCPTQPLLCG